MCRREANRNMIQKYSVDYFKETYCYLPLLFFIILIPLTEQLNTGYEEHTTKTKFHTYMDSLQQQVIRRKSSKNKCKRLELSVVLPMWNSDLDKCAKLVLKKRKLVQLHSLNLDIDREIQELEQREQHQQMKH